MSARQLDLPLEDTPAGRFLPWIVAGLIYLSVLALAVAAVADGAARLLEMRPRIVTVALPSSAGGVEGEEVATSDDDPAVAAALAVLRGTRGVITARPVPAVQVGELLQSWIGEEEPAPALPLPRLIDVTLDRQTEVSFDALEERLRAAVPGATIDREEMNLGQAEELARYVRTFSLGIGAVVVIGALVIVGVITRMSFGLHRDTVELLRLMGAPDGYLARQFERHALLGGLRGALLGFAGAVVTVLALVYGSRLFELMSTTLPLSLRPVDWVVLGFVPVIGALLITAVARLTALWSRTRMP